MRHLSAHSSASTHDDRRGATANGSSDTPSALIPAAMIQLLRRLARATRAPDWTFSHLPLAEGDAWRLRPVRGPFADVLGLVFVTLFWNGITWSVLLVWWMNASRTGAIACTIFASLHILFGLVMAWATLRLLAKGLLSPRVALTLDAPTLGAGVDHTIRWTLTKGRQRLSTLELAIVLREECQYKRGTDTITEHHEISRHVLAVHDTPEASGRCHLLLPPRITPGFTTTSNQLIWVLQVRGSVRTLPNVDDEYPLPVIVPAAAVAPLAAKPLSDNSAMTGQEALLALAEPDVPLHPNQPRAVVVGTPNAATLRLRWTTSGKGDSHSVVAAELALPAGCSAVAVTLPSSPPAWRGALLSLTWRLELLYDDDVLSQELTVITPLSTIC